MANIQSSAAVDSATTLLLAYQTGERNFTNADLSAADLSGVDLKGADFSYADFSEANLTKANLRGAVSVLGETSM